MNTYLELALRYLKMNKKRSAVTIFAVTVAVAILYMGLNVGWCELLKARNTLREEQDYEIVYLTESQEEIERISADELVKSAQVGSYYEEDEKKTYPNALYINTTSPYRMSVIKEKLDAKYGTESRLNVDLAETYLQGDGDSAVFVLIIWVLLICFIFAILGVGVVRNSIQLSTFEQIRDYGNLRCIGASKNQLKRIIYTEGMVLELTGTAIGVIIGFGCSLLAGVFLKVKVGFHLIPLVPILIAFLGDLYFAMNDSSKIVVKMTPVSAIRGEFRIRKEKIKTRRRNLFGIIFGVEGDYAYKNLLRSPGRFHKTVWGIGLGMAVFIGIMTLLEGIQNEKDRIIDSSHYYQIYYVNNIDASETPEEVKAGLPSTDYFERIRDMDGISEAKRSYSANVILADWEANYSHLTNEYLTKTISGYYLKQKYEDLQSEQKEESEKLRAINYFSKVVCCGYDEADYKRYEKELVDGTLEVSDNGIVLVKGGMRLPNDSNESMVINNIEVDFMDYKVGDTITLLDMKRLRKLVQEELVDAKKEKNEKIAKLAETRESMEYDDYEQQVSGVQIEYNKEESIISEKCRRKLVREGAYKTYTIEGIVQKDVNWEGDETTFTTFVLPLENYYNLTGLDESCVSGMRYRVEKASGKLFEKICMDEGILYDVDQIDYCFSNYQTDMMVIGGMESIFRIIVGGILFAFLMVAFNIVNTTASGIYLRRKEFAQLRVIGVSKKRLLKMVMLEGVIQSIVANGIGIVVGFGAYELYFGTIVKLVIGIEPQFPVVSAVLGVVVSTLLLCVSIYVPIKNMKMNMANDLATGGDGI